MNIYPFICICLYQYCPPCSAVNFTDSKRRAKRCLFASSTCSDGEHSFPVEYYRFTGQIQDPKTKLCYNNVGYATPTCNEGYTLSGKNCVKNTY
jgi:hypothetical protein